MEILTSVKRLYIRFKSLVNDFVYSFGRAALLLLVEVQNHTVPVRERRRIRVNIGIFMGMAALHPKETRCSTRKLGKKLRICLYLRHLLMTQKSNGKARPSPRCKKPSTPASR